MGWFDKLTSKLTKGSQAISDVVDKVESAVGKVEHVAEEVKGVTDTIDKVTKTAEELLLEKENELSLANIVIGRLREEILERVAHIETKLDLIAAPNYRLVSEAEFKTSVKGAAKREAGAGPNSGDAIVTHYYENGLVVGMEVRWPQKKFYYVAKLELPSLADVKNELREAIRV